MIFISSAIISKVCEINDETYPYPGSESYFHTISYGAGGNDGKIKLEFCQKFCFCSYVEEITIFHFLLLDIIVRVRILLVITILMNLMQGVARLMSY